MNKYQEALAAKNIYSKLMIDLIEKKNAKNITDKQLADLTGLSEQTIRNYLSFNAYPRLDKYCEMMCIINNYVVKKY